MVGLGHNTGKWEAFWEKWRLTKQMFIQAMQKNILWNNNYFRATTIFHMALLLYITFLKFLYF